MQKADNDGGARAPVTLAVGLQAAIDLLRAECVRLNKSARETPSMSNAKSFGRIAQAHKHSAEFLKQKLRDMGL